MRGLILWARRFSKCVVTLRGGFPLPANESTTPAEYQASLNVRSSDSSFALKNLIGSQSQDPACNDGKDIQVAKTGEKGEREDDAQGN